MKNKISHTPTPWAVDGCFFGQQIDSQNFLTVGGSSSLLPQEECLANAAFIVRAVNSHDELVRALRSAIGYMHMAKIDLATIRVFDNILAKSEGR